ncbi:hypothetical protein OROGR_026638 [Orobanche gracilis]
MTSLLCTVSISPVSPQSSATFFASFSGSPNFLKSSYRRSRRVGFKCNYTDPAITQNSDISTIDVVAEVKTERIVVLGGSGFVGSAICKAAVSKGIEVISLSRSGRPSYSGSWVDQVTWLTGDVFCANWDEVLPGATTVVSTIGGFGSEEHMQRINGEANVVAVNAAKEFE